VSVASLWKCPLLTKSVRYLYPPWYPFIYFRWKSWPNHIFHNNIVTCFYFYQFKNSICIHVCTLFLTYVGPNWQIKYSILYSCCLCKIRGWIPTTYLPTIDNGTLNYLSIDISDWWKLHPIDIFDRSERVPIPAVRLCIPWYRNIGKRVPIHFP
jgi:hypothetical protein